MEKVVLLRKWHEVIFGIYISSCTRQSLHNSATCPSYYTFLRVKLVLLIVILVNLSKLAFVFGKPSTNQTESTAQLVLATYLPDYRFASDNVNRISLYVTDLILFSISPNSDGSLGPCCLDKSHYNMAHTSRRQRKRSLCEDSVSSDSCVGYGGEPLRLLVSIGGGGRSQNFASLVDNEESRSRFVEEILELCTREDLNGVDFDWEQPQDKNQMMGYMTLIVETWSAFQNSLSNLLVTVALHPNQFLPKAIFQYIDRVHLMTYDMIMPSSKGGYLHHADFNMAKQLVEAFVERGCPRSKLALGIPAYGRHGKDPNQVMTFSDLVSVNGVGGLHARQESNGYLYDSPINVRAKVKWAAENQLAGVFFWEAGQDVIFESGVKERGLLQSAADEATQLASVASKGDVWQLNF